MKLFTKHPESVGETYLQHLLYASCSGFKMITGGLACILHGIFPFWCEKTGSTMLLNLVQKHVERMPVCEKRFVDLSHTIQQKNLKNTHNSTAL